MSQGKKDVYSKRYMNSIPAPLESDSDPEFQSGPYIAPEPKSKKKKKGEPALKKRRTNTKRIQSDEEDSVSVYVPKEKKAGVRNAGAYDPNPLKKYFVGMLDFLSVSDCEADDEEDPKDDTEKPSTSSQAKPWPTVKDDSVTESSSDEEGPSASTSQLKNPVSVGPRTAGKAPATGNISGSVTASDSGGGPASQPPPNPAAKSAARPILSSVARGKLPQAQNGEPDSVTESESEKEPESVTEDESDPELEARELEKLKKLEPRPCLDIKPGQKKKTAFVLDAQEEVEIPEVLNTYLRDYQREGVEFLYRQYKEGKGCLLGDDMGLVRKTIQTIAFLSAIMKKTGLNTDAERRRKHVSKLQDTPNWRDKMPPADDKWPTCLIIAPSSVTGNWEREFEKWGYFEVGMYVGRKSERKTVLTDFKLGRLDVVITSLDLARMDIDYLDELAFTCVIVDEVHRVKDPKTALSGSLHRFVSRRRFGLTGTAIQNNYSEWWAILNWTNPGQVGTQKQWRGYVEKPLMAAQSTTSSEETRAIGMSVALILKEKLLPDFFLRRTKEIIKHQMPKKIDQVVFCPLTKLQTKAYQNILATSAVRNLVQRDEPCDCGSKKARKICHHKFEAADVFRYMSVLIKLSNHLALIMPGDPKDSPEQVKANRELARFAFPHDMYRNLPSYGEISLNPDACGKWAVLDTLLKTWRTEDKTNKVLIFTKSVKLLEMIEHYLKLKSYGKHLKLDGSTKQEHRMGIVEEFNTDPDIFIFLISTAAGGTGLNLTGANKVVIFDPNWNPALDLQAMDRAFRIGQLRDVTVYRLLAMGTVEELIYARQIYKQQQMAIGYDASIQTRYFEAVQGDNSKKGELFGLENIFKLQQDKVATQMVIENAHIAELDWALANMDKKKARKTGSNELVEAAGKLKDEDAEMQSKEKEKEKGEDKVKDKDKTLKGLGLLLFDDNVPQKDVIAETFKQIGVKYMHKNDEILAPSNVEKMKNEQIIENLRKRKRESAASGSNISAKAKGKAKAKAKAKEEPTVVWPPPNRGKYRIKVVNPEDVEDIKDVPQLEKRREALILSGAVTSLADLPKFAKDFVQMSVEDQKKALELIDVAYEAELLRIRDKSEESSSD